MARRNSTPLTKEEKEYINNNYVGTPCKKMAEILEEKFGGLHGKTQMELYYRKNGLKSGLDGRFVKGCKPKNKGKKQCEYMSQEGIERTKLTRFKKGNPTLKYPVGTMRLRADGYYWIKVKEPAKWQEYHRWLWEQDNGKLQKGMKIVHLDGNLTNNSMENLYVTSDGALALANHNIGLTGDKELNKAILKISDIKMKIYQRRKEENEN